MTEQEKWHEALDDIQMLIMERLSEFEDARFVIVAVHPGLEDLATTSNGCPHEAKQMLTLAVERNEELLLIHEASGEHGRN